MGLKRPNEYAAKAEKTKQMAHGQILKAIIMENQQPSSEQEQVQRLSRRGVGENPKCRPPATHHGVGEDIVYARS